MRPGLNFLVYLAGPISGLTYDQGQDWREYAMANLPQEIHGMSPLRAKRERLGDAGVIEGSYEDDPMTSVSGITWRDKFDCMRADAVLFNLLGATRVSVGTMLEYGWASAARPNPIIVTVIEKAGNVHDHPMVRGVTTHRVETLDQGLKVLEWVLLPSGKGTPGKLPPLITRRSSGPGRFAALYPMLEPLNLNPPHSEGGDPPEGGRPPEGAAASLSGSQKRVQSAIRSAKTRSFST